MNEDLFAEWVASVREGGAILRGETAPTRQFVVEELDVKNIRRCLLSDATADGCPSRPRPVLKGRAKE